MALIRSAGNDMANIRIIRCNNPRNITIRGTAINQNNQKPASKIPKRQYHVPCQTVVGPKSALIWAHGLVFGLVLYCRTDLGLRTGRIQTSQAGLFLDLSIFGGVLQKIISVLQKFIRIFRTSSEFIRISRSVANFIRIFRFAAKSIRNRPDSSEIFRSRRNFLPVKLRSREAQIATQKHIDCGLIVFSS
ncbi:hypothetical protein LXL04_024139 [Taraxacum kok-saghyz]